MAETHTIHDPFLNRPVEISSRLVDRLRGKYAVGPTLDNGEPEFGWRHHQVPPIQHEAANEIDRLSALLKWRPIETAPKDGTEVDLWCQNQSTLTTGGARITDCHYHCDEWLKYGDDAEIGWTRVHNATHWMPIPGSPGVDQN